MIGTHKTTVTTDNGTTEIVYHSTKVVKFNNNTITLNTGGWKTNTTKNRMNQTSQQFDLGFNVYQKNWEWYLEYNGNTYSMLGVKTEIDRMNKEVFSSWNGKTNPIKN